MNAPFRFALVVLGLTTLSSVVYAQSSRGLPEPVLGRDHLWLKFGRAFLGSGAAQEWGVSREEYLELEGYHATGSELYVGGEVGRLGNGTGVDRDGIPIQDLRFRWLEGNVKGGVDLRHALSLDYGAGVALFYVEGREVTMASGQTFIDRLSDFGYGTQIFADFNWRAHHLILGLDVKYQEAYDLVDVDYSNFRLGAHLGIAF